MALICARMACASIRRPVLLAFPLTLILAAGGGREQTAVAPHATEGYGSSSPPEPHRCRAYRAPIYRTSVSRIPPGGATSDKRNQGARMGASPVRKHGAARAGPPKKS